MQQIFKSKDSKFIIIIIIYGVDRYYYIMDIGDNNNNNKLASLEATLVRNSAHPLTHLLTHRGKV